jgi:fatty-acyl-CoA synthase
MRGQGHSGRRPTPNDTSKEGRVAVPPSPQEIAHITLGTLFAQALAGSADRVALAGDGRTLTYRQLRDEVGRLLSVFDDLGLQTGDGIGLGTKGMTIEFAALYIACQIAGLWTTELSPNLPVDVIVDRVLSTNARLLIVDDGTDADRMERLGASLPGKLAAVSTNNGTHSQVIDLAAHSRDAEPVDVVPRPPGAHCGIMFTSGSTGKPKPVLIPSRGAGMHATMVLATLQYPAAPVTVVPVTHQLILQFLFVPTLLLGGTVVTVAHYSPAKIIDAALRHRAQAVFLTTSDIYDLAQREDTGGLCDHLELIFYGGEPMSAAKLSTVTEAFGQIFVGAYGQTETLTSAFLHPKDHDPGRPELLSAAGRALIGARIEVWGDDGPVPAGEPGEIVVSSPGCMLGYLDMDDATRKAIDKGWVRTGDIGYLDEHGYIHVLDRAKFVFRSAESTVYPHVVEQELTRHPDVLRAAVVGAPDPELQHRICAAVTVRPGASVTTDELLAMPIDGLVRLHEVRIVDKLPVTAANKVDRTAVQALFSSEALSVASAAAGRRLR